MQVIEAIQRRRSVNNFDTARTLSTETIEHLVQLATQAPSSFNMQNWRFIAVTAADQKTRLRGVAMDQAKVEQAPVTFIVLGDQHGYRESARVMGMSVEAGIVDAGTADFFAGATPHMYGSSPQMARDEAVRSGSLAAMTLMLAAEGMGLVSCPMIGFDAAKVCELFNIEERFVPVMLLPVGHEAPGNWARKVRRPLDEVLGWA